MMNWVLLFIFTLLLLMNVVRGFIPVWAQCPNDRVEDTGCPSGWHSYQAKCYEFTIFPLETYETAKESCNRRGARLLRIDNLDEHEFIKTWIDNIAINRTMRWYTAGIMDPAKFGQYKWDGHPLNVEEFRTEVMQIWIDKLPEQIDSPNWPIDRRFVIYGSDGQRWGWFLDIGTENRSYVCEVDKSVVRQLLADRRNADYGQDDVNNVRRGPCFIQQPENQWFVPGMNVRTYVSFLCLSYGNPDPTYTWYNLIQNTTGHVNRRRITPVADGSGRLSQTRGMLTIHGADPKLDSDYFQCAATNEHGTVFSRAARIIFGNLDTFDKQPRQVTSKEAYTGVVIPCSAPFHSPPESLLYSFYMIREGRAEPEPVLPELRKNLFISESKGLLCFSEVTTQDSGTYVCMISMKGDLNILSDSRKSPDIPLFVREGNKPAQEPIIQDDFPNVFPSVPFRGDDVRLECFAYGYIMNQRMIYTWTKKDGSALPAKAIIQDFGRVVLIPKVQVDDQGEYICNVKDFRGISSRPKPIILRIQAPPYFIVSPSDQYVDVGIDVTFVCELSGIPPANHTWYYNDKPAKQMILDGQLDSNRYSVDDGGYSRATLKIAKVTKSDSAMVGCMGINTLGIEAVFAELRVLEFTPNFKKFPVAPTEGMQGDKAIIECRPEGAPTPVLKWFFNGGQLDTAPAVRNALSGEMQCAGKHCTLPNGNLMVSGLVVADAGQYTCEASNSLGTAASTSYLSVVPSLEFSMFPISRIVQLNTTVDLPCRASINSHLDMDFAWFFEGIEIKFDRLDIDARRYEATQFDRLYTRTFGTLRIRNIQFEYEGNYSCVIRTAVANIQKWALIHVAGPPGPCAGVDVPVVINTTSVTVKWTAGAAHGDVVNYFVIEAQSFLYLNKWTIIVAMLLDTPDIRILFNGQDRGRRQYQLTNLASNMRYQIRVRAANKFGLGDPSPPSDWFTTLPQAPTKLVQNVTGGGGKRGTLVIQWEPLSVVDQNADKFLYTVEYKESRQKDYQSLRGSNMRPMDGGRYWEATVTIGEKKDYKPFDVRVRAENSVGPGPFTEPIQILSSAAVPTNAPRDVNAGALNATALMVTWSPPLTTAGEGPILGYRIVYWRRNHDCRDQRAAMDRFQNGQRQTVNGEVKSGVMIGLHMDTYYCISVQMYNSAGDGPESSYFEQTTYKRPPREFPTLVKVNSTGQPNEVLISWVGVQAQPDEESVDGYRIRYWHSGAPFKETAQDVDVGLKNEGYLQDVSSNTRYNVRVYAYSRGGVGQLSSPMVQFMIIPQDQCIQGATWDAADIRYLFVCAGCNLRAAFGLSLLLPLLVRWLVSRGL